MVLYYSIGKDYSTVRIRVLRGGVKRGCMVFYYTIYKDYSTYSCSTKRVCMVLYYSIGKDYSTVRIRVLRGGVKRGCMVFYYSIYKDYSTVRIRVLRGGDTRVHIWPSYVVSVNATVLEWRQRHSHFIFIPNIWYLDDFVMSESNPKRQRNTPSHLVGVPTSSNVRDSPSDLEILPDVADCSATQSDPGNISQSDPEFLPDVVSSSKTETLGTHLASRISHPAGGRKRKRYLHPIPLSIHRYKRTHVNQALRQPSRTHQFKSSHPPKALYQYEYLYCRAARSTAFATPGHDLGVYLGVHQLDGPAREAGRDMHRREQARELARNDFPALGTCAKPPFQAGPPSAQKPFTRTPFRNRHCIVIDDATALIAFPKARTTTVTRINSLQFS